ncbi:MAG: hypothetical protein K6F88_05355, partial [Ruminococcus sp.]|nr:hypothetical protein [Ruminococcus sp.]
LRGASLEISVYYRPKTSITIKQEMDGNLNLETSVLSTVTISSTTTVSSPFKAYTTAGRNTMNSYQIDSYRSDVTETDDQASGKLYRTTYFGTHKGVKPQIQIEPKGSRYVSSVKILKKTNGAYAEVPSSAYSVDGTGDVYDSITYTFLNAVDFGDDYRVEIVYGRQQRLTVKAVMRNANEQETEINNSALYTQSGLDKITVTGHRFDISGADTNDSAFSDTADETNQFDSFEVTSAPRTVNSATNTRVNIDTSFNANSEYVIANIIAYNDQGTNLNLAVPGTKTYNGNTVTTYENSTLPSLSSANNVTVKIILTKVASVKVNVFTILEDGTTKVDGALQNSNAYVNVSVSSNAVNKKAIITADNEGAYYTGDFDITYNPHSRTVKVLEGSSLDVFAQLPGNSDYVVSRVTTNGNGYNNIEISGIRMVEGNMRETLNTNSTVIYSDRNYELNIFIQKARSIYSYVYKDEGNGVEGYGGGTVTIRGTHAATGAVPFTKINPADERTPDHYSGMNGDSYSNHAFTVEAKAIRDTNITFDVTPPSQYSIKNVVVKKGTAKATATNVAYTSTAPNSSGKVTYTVSEPMGPNDDLFIDVSYAVMEGGTITVDFKYTDDYEHYYNLFDSGEHGNSTMNVSVTGTSYGVRKQVARNLVTGDEQFSWSGITYSENDIPDSIPEGKYKFYVAAGNCLRVNAATAYINGKWYVAIEDQCGVYRGNNKISSTSTSSRGSLPDISYTMTAGDSLRFQYRLAPMATVGSVAVDRNSYDGTPENALKQNSGSAVINASPPSASGVSHAIGGGSSGRSNSTSSTLDVIAMGSTINTVDVYTSTFSPGEIVSVTLYKFDRSVVGINTAASYSAINGKNYEGKWDLEYNATTNINSSPCYHYVLPAGTSPIEVERDKSYRVMVIYDKIRISNQTGQSAYPESTYVKPYVYYGSNDINDIDIYHLSVNNLGGYENLGWNNIKSYSKNTIDQKTAAFYVLVADLPREELSLSSCSFKDYTEGSGYVDIKDALNESYTTRNHNGVIKYYYIYRINPTDAHPIDNTIEFSTKFTLRTDSAPPAEQSYDCDVTVEQWNRDTYDGNYVAATNQSVQFLVPDGEVLKVGSRGGESRNPITITTSTGSFYTNCDPSGSHATRGRLKITPLPITGYNVERVQITDSSTYNYYPDANGEINYRLRTSNVTIKVYYSRPLVRISSTNEGNKGKATVEVNTGNESETVLNENTFTNGTFVTKGNDADVVIKPLTYEDEGSEYYYSVASIRVGNAYNNTTTVYTADSGDVANDGYTIEKMDDGSQYRMTLSNVQSDKYIFIQLVGKESILFSNLQLNQKIKYAGTNDYVDCADGSVTLNGTLSGNSTPMNFDGVDLSSKIMSNTATIEGTVVYGTSLSLSNIVPPADYTVESIEVERLGSSAGYTENNGTYTLNNPAPDSGATVITVKYGMRRTEFTLNYKYYSREWNADDESNYENNNKVIGVNTQPDKTYTVKVNLTDGDIKDGKPLNRVLVNNAPSIDDLYKDCKWKFDNNHVNYNGNTVTITANQPAKTFTVKFFKNNGDQNDFESITQVKLNSFVKKNGDFIEADEKSGNSNFAYWLVKKAGTNKEITKCYSREFNLRVTADIDVVAYYGERAKSITLSDAAYSREQTNDGNGNISDKLFADFILSYMEESGKLFNTSIAASEGVEALEGYSSGLIVEFDSQIKLDREDEKGHKLTDQEKVVFPANDAVNKNTIISFIKGNNPSIPNTRTLLNLPVNNNSYNNKNRVDKALSFNNTESARHTVLRAYYYVKDANGNVQLTDPVYFYLYDIGNSDASTN